MREGDRLESTVWDDLMTCGVASESERLSREELVALFRQTEQTIGFFDIKDIDVQARGLDSQTRDEEPLSG